MSGSDDFRREVETRLSPFATIRTRAMFGGVGIYADELFVALIADGRLYFKVDSTNVEDYIGLGTKPFVPFDSGKPMNYWELPAEVYSDDERLETWVKKSMSVASSARRAKRPKG